jgi:hypothetical protein
VQVLDEAPADGTEPLDEHRSAIEIRVEGMSHGGLDPMEDPSRGGGARVAGTSVRLRTPEDVGRALGDRVHVRLARVHVCRRDVGPVERLHELRVAKQQRATVLAPGRRDLGDRDHGLPSSERGVGGGLLQGHGAGEP